MTFPSASTISTDSVMEIELLLGWIKKRFNYLVPVLLTTQTFIDSVAVE
jgi:hypothetical protein